MSKLIKAIIFLIIFVGVVVVLNSLITNYVNQQNTATSQVAQNNQQSQSSETASNPSAGTQSQTPVSDQTQPAGQSSTPTATVTVVQAGNIGNSYLPTSGTVSSKTLIGVYPAVNGAVKKINFHEGDFVKAGDTIMELTGTNGQSNPVETQFQIAKQNYDFAKQSVDNLSATNQLSLQNAQLQLQNAVNQAQAFVTDLSTMDININSLQQGLNLLNNSMSTSNSKTSMDLNNAQQNLNSLISSVNQLQTQKQITIGQIQSAGNYSGTPDQICANNNFVPPTDPNANPNANPTSNFDLTSLCATYVQQNQSLSDLYTSLDKAKLAYNDAVAATQLANNQTQGQLIQSQGQLDAAVANKQSTEQKAGYDGQTITALQQAQKAFESTQQQLKSAQDQANSQLKLAKLNYDLAQSQLDQLTLKAPEDGIIAGLDLNVNDTVSPQTKLFSVLTPNDFEIVLHVDNETAGQIHPGSIAQVEIAGKWVDANVSSVSPIADSKTGLVEVKVALPKIFFRVGQILNVRLPLQTTSPNTSSLFLPLDAVTIGTHEQFVYIVDNKQTKDSQPAANIVGTAKKVDVTTGKIIGDQIEITSGLTGNEQVILQGSHQLIEGQPITISSN